MQTFRTTDEIIAATAILLLMIVLLASVVFLIAAIAILIRKYVASARRGRRIALPRFRVRTLMLVVLLLGAVFELSILCGRSVNACWNALYHADRAWTCRFILGKSAVEVDDIDSSAYRDDIGPGVAHILAEARYHQKMSAKFYDAAWHPWRRVSIDPPPFEPIITPLLYKELEELSSEANAIVSSIERMSTEEMEEALSKLDAIGKSVMDIRVGHAKSNSANSAAN